MNNLGRHLTFANVVACLALFIALGGASYAAMKLPKNSVGTRQIKNNAITGAKIQDGAITGSKVNVGSLGTVPLAARADSAGRADSSARADTAVRADTASHADSAATASNANTLGGLGSDAFAKSNRQFFGSATIGATDQTLFTAAGIEVSAVANAGSTFKIKLTNNSGNNVDVSYSYVNSVSVLASGGSLTREPTEVRVASFTIASTSDPSKVLLVQCGSDFGPNLLYCFGQTSPAAA
jgi:hypothetical protein